MVCPQDSDNRLFIFLNTAVRDNGDKDVTKRDNPGKVEQSIM